MSLFVCLPGRVPCLLPCRLSYSSGHQVACFGLQHRSISAAPLTATPGSSRTWEPLDNRWTHQKHTKKKMGPKHEQKFHCPTKWWTLGGVLSHGGTPSYHPNVHGSFHDKPSSYWGTSIIPANSMGRGWAPQISHGHGERTQAASRKVK